MSSTPRGEVEKRIISLVAEYAGLTEEQISIDDDLSSDCGLWLSDIVALLQGVEETYEVILVEKDPTLHTGGGNLVLDTGITVKKIVDAVADSNLHKEI